MKLKIPQSNTSRFKIYKAVYEHGPIKHGELASRMPSMNRESIGSALQIGRVDGILSHHGSAWSVTDAARKYFDDLTGGQDHFVPQIVPPRITNVWTPEMKGYEENLRRHWRVA